MIMCSLPRARVQFLVRELRSHKLSGMAQKKVLRILNIIIYLQSPSLTTHIDEWTLHTINVILASSKSLGQTRTIDKSS